MKKPKNEPVYLGQDIQNKIIYLSQFSNEVLAAALLFTIANTIPGVIEEELNDEQFSNLIDSAGEEAVSLADNINQLYNKEKITRH
jgi:hypothetical protein